MHGGINLIVPKLDKSQVLGALRATGSTDPDILYARTEELLAETKSMRFLAFGGIGVGAVCTLTIFLAVLGIPLIVYGIWVKSNIKRNIGIAEAALAEYLTSMPRRHHRTF